MTHLAVLGLGAMGSGIAANLADAGHRVVVWNRTPERASRLAADRDGIVAAPSARAAADDAEVVISMVTDDDAARSVWLDPGTGALGGLSSGAIAVESSTVTPGWVGELGRAVGRTGARFAEAPVLGSRPQLARGALVQLVGADAEVVERLRPVLEVNAGAVRHLGPVGAAAPVKLAVNTLLAVQAAVGAEVVGVLGRAGLDPAAARDLLRDLPVTSPAMQVVLDRFAAGDASPNFPIDLVAKDLRYFVGLAADPTAVPVADATAGAFAAAVASGLGGIDITGIVRHLPSTGPTAVGGPLGG